MYFIYDFQFRAPSLIGYSTSGSNRNSNGSADYRGGGRCGLVDYIAVDYGLRYTYDAHIETYLYLCLRLHVHVQWFYVVLVRASSSRLPDSRGLADRVEN